MFRKQFTQQSLKLFNSSISKSRNFSCISSHFIKNESINSYYNKKCDSRNNLTYNRNNIIITNHNKYLLNVDKNLINCNYTVFRSFKTTGKSINLTQNVKKTNDEVDSVTGIPKELSLFEKFKLMYKQYWYVLVPVHLITSLGWFAGFYYIAKSGVDIPSMLKTLHFSETIINKFTNSEAGNFAISYLMYKIATPIRYTVTLGGTTWAIKYLSKKGYIKPVPTKDEFQQMYKDKKNDIARKKLKK